MAHGTTGWRPQRAGGAGRACRPLPAGFGVVMDPGTKQLDEETLFGGAARCCGCRRRPGRPGRAAGRPGAQRRRGQAGPQAAPTPAWPTRARPALATRPDVTVLIPVRDRAVLLDRCLTALAGRYPVVVVDDGSADPSAIAAVAAAHGATLIRRPASGGPGPRGTPGWAA